jgi:hypothetical protein
MLELIERLTRPRGIARDRWSVAQEEPQPDERSVTTDWTIFRPRPPQSEQRTEQIGTPPAELHDITPQEAYKPKRSTELVGSNLF